MTEVIILELTFIFGGRMVLKYSLAIGIFGYNINPFFI